MSSTAAGGAAASETTRACGRAPTPRPRPERELADAFRLYGDDYRRAHGMPLLHHKVMHAIEVCRTAALGGHVEQCDACGFGRVSYNSCRNRHCPKCQATTKAKWLEARKAELLPVGYFHVVFTLPHELNPIAEVLENKDVIYDILFRTVADTLKQFGANPDNGLGGAIGFTALLHTWDQQLRTHIHLHCVVPGGALSFDKQRWLPLPDDRFLFPVKALSIVFRAKFIEALTKSFADGKLTFPSSIAHLGTQNGFRELTNSLWKKDWIVYAKEPFGGPEKVLDYLGRYTHRVAISNHRIRNVEDGRVTFTYRDRADGDALKQRTLPADEFIERFLLHVLPKGYVRIRHFGFLANRVKQTDLVRCRQLLGLPPQLPTVPQTDPRQTVLRLTGIDIAQCPRCHRGVMHITETFDRHSTVTPIHHDRSPPDNAAGTTDHEQQP